jgi:hypothetical protein
MGKARRVWLTNKDEWNKSYIPKISSLEVARRETGM